MSEILSIKAGAVKSHGTPFSSNFTYIEINIDYNTYLKIVELSPMSLDVEIPTGERFLCPLSSTLVICFESDKRRAKRLKGE